MKGMQPQAKPHLLIAARQGRRVILGKSMRPPFGPVHCLEDTFTERGCH